AGAGGGAGAAAGGRGGGGRGGAPGAGPRHQREQQEREQNGLPEHQDVRPPSAGAAAKSWREPGARRILESVFHYLMRARRSHRVAGSVKTAEGGPDAR